MIDKIRKYELSIVVFICGAAVMVFELVGSRVIAPYVGTSTYVWSSIIGVVLGSLSAGYYYGGRLADAKPNTRPLAVIVFVSAMVILFSTVVRDPISLSVVVLPVSLEIKSLIISIILFAPASFLLGMVSPYAVRLSIKDVEKAGRTSGNLYAISTFGSITGTFLAGFYLIPYVGLFTSLVLLSLTLILVSIFLLRDEVWRFFSKIISPLLLLSLILAVAYPVLGSMVNKDNIIADIDTEYSRIFVTKETDFLTGRPIIALLTDPFAFQSAIFVDNPDELVFEYAKFFKMVEVIKPEAKNALLIGGCVYTYPRDFLRNFSDAVMDVVEIDPGMTEVAKKYFALKDDPRMNIIHEDGRIFLNSNKKKYDVIFNDAFNSFSIPFQLTTVEAVRKNFEALEDDGVVFVNLISAIEGDKGKFFRAEYATFKSVFPNVYVFPLNISRGGEATQNIVLVATKKENGIDFSSANANPLLKKYTEKLWTRPIADDVPILTDNFAPVESYRRMSM